MDFDPSRDFWPTGGKSTDGLVPAVDPADLRNVLSVLRTLDSKVAAIGTSVLDHTRSSLRLEPKVLPKKAANENKKQPELDNASFGKGANVHLDGTVRFDAQEQA